MNRHPGQATETEKSGTAVRMSKAGSAAGASQAQAGIMAQTISRVGRGVWMALGC